MARLSWALLALLLVACAASCSALPCPRNCSVTNRAMYGSGKVNLGPMPTVLACADTVYLTGFNWFQYQPATAATKPVCLAFNKCSFIYAKRGLFSGNSHRCSPPAPPPAKLGYCSATQSGCRCPYLMVCVPAGDSKKCCCPPELPKPVFNKRHQLAGCRK